AAGAEPGPGYPIFPRHLGDLAHRARRGRVARKLLLPVWRGAADPAPPMDFGMKRLLFAPALALVRLLTLPVGFALVVLLLALQTLLGAVWPPGPGGVPLPLFPLPALLAGYVLGALYLWTGHGMSR